ncbi:T9SS type A sorting domain-containing protein [Aurantibacillus circumpalustris]|uniref:T9SS type A sorting domain-containing protein n=1 Tax=Aurantibacillus circumpalustris TaxID=3036359 RepID=UPI00295AFABE|nr:T9SS type A sorting domain-containing protein [Aurantibacillus circumpalustris]
MKRLQKNLLLLNNVFSSISKRRILLCLIFLDSFLGLSQIANFVTNGGFEKKINCNYPNNLNKAIGWNCLGVDTTNFGSFLCAINCYSNAPNNGAGFQYPRSGDTYYRMQVLCQNCPLSARIYPKNRLKDKLKAGATYCTKMYVSRQDASPYGISDLDFFFGDNSLDTINYCYTPLTYLNPQVKNPSTNIISDTLNWVLITGTFVATGNEKYLVLGNFETDNGTTSSLVDTSFGTSVWAVYFVDDVSCIDIDLQAFGGNDGAVIPGDSVYLGRESDVGIDEACMWYKLPTVITPTTPAIATIAGFWIKPVTSCTYVVRQEICGHVKWDTVIIAMNPVGLVQLSVVEGALEVFPNPAQDFIELKISNINLLKEFNSISIYNNLGQLMREEEVVFENKTLILNTNDLENGVYFLNLKSNKLGTVSKRFVIAR